MLDRAQLYSTIARQQWLPCELDISRYLLTLKFKRANVSTGIEATNEKIPLMPTIARKYESSTCSIRNNCGNCELKRRSCATQEFI
jgi:hypothetical protein